MKALYHFVVKLEKTHHDTIELENGTYFTSTLSGRSSSVV